MIVQASMPLIHYLKFLKCEELFLKQQNSSGFRLFLG